MGMPFCRTFFLRKKIRSIPSMCGMSSVISADQRSMTRKMRALRSLFVADSVHGCHAPTIPSVILHRFNSHEIMNTQRRRLHVQALSRSTGQVD